MKKYDKNNLIVKNNRLIEAQYKLSLQEQKLVLSVVSMINPYDKKFHEYRLSVKEFMQLANVEGKDYHSRLIKFSKSLLKKPIVITKNDGNKLVVNWFSAIEEINKGVWGFSFEPKLKPYLLQLKQEFTNYQLRNIIQLNSKYSVRCYELLKQYLSVGERVVELKDFRLLLGIETNQYKRFNAFKLRILEQAKKELSQKTDIQITWKAIKTVRKITGIHFFIKKNKLQKKAIIQVKKNNIKAEINEIQKLINFVPEKHQNKETVKNIIEKYLKSNGYEYVKKHIEYSNINAKKNYTVFFKKSLKENWEFEITDIEKIKETKKKKQEEDKKEIVIQNEYEARRLLRIKIVDNLTPEIEKELRDYIYVQKNNKPVSHDKQHKRLKYKKGALVTYLMSYLNSTVQEYIKSNNSVSTDKIKKWFKGYTGIREKKIFDSIIQD